MTSHNAIRGNVILLSFQGVSFFTRKPLFFEFFLPRTRLKPILLGFCNLDIVKIVVRLAFFDNELI
jgi:hypothetical protein